MTYDPGWKLEARRLREEDEMPIKDIARVLGIAVGTAHVWTRDIALSEDQVKRNSARCRGPFTSEAAAKRSRAWSERCRNVRRSYQDEGRRAAREGDSLHLAGSMLYWAEGTKCRNSVRMSNSDVQMLRLFRRFLQECLMVEDERFALTLNVYTGNELTVSEIENHWLEGLELPRSCLRKHMLNHTPTSSSGQKKNKLPYGVCSLVVSDTRVVQHIYGAIQEYAGFERPEWLDGPPRRRLTSAYQ